MSAPRYFCILCGGLDGCHLDSCRAKPATKPRWHRPGYVESAEPRPDQMPHDCVDGTCTACLMGRALDRSMEALRQSQAARRRLLAMVKEYADDIISDPEAGTYRACCGADWSDGIGYHAPPANAHKPDCRAAALIAEEERRQP